MASANMGFFFSSRRRHTRFSRDWSSECALPIFLEVDVLPDIQLGPVRDWKHADALALVLARVVQAPEFGPLHLRVPAMLRRPEREDALLRTRDRKSVV